MQFLCCFADVLGFTFFACQTIHNIGSLAGYPLLDMECLILLCHMNGLAECPFNTCIATFIIAFGESNGWLRDFALVHLCVVNQFPFRSIEIPTTLLTLGGLFVDVVFIQWWDDVDVTGQSPTHKHVIQISIPSVCYCWRVRKDCFTPFT